MCLEELEAIHAQMSGRDCTIDQELSLFVDDDIRFHQLPFKVADRSHQYEEIRTLTRHTILGLGTFVDLKRSREILAEHGKMIKTLSSKDPNGIYSTLRWHLLNGAGGVKQEVKKRLELELPGKCSGVI